MDSDRSRFKKIIRGKIKKELKNFISDNDLIARKGDKTIKSLFRLMFQFFPLVTIMVRAVVMVREK